MVPSKSICVAILMLMATLCLCEFRVARQASSCSAGAQCIPLRSCPSILNLLQVPTTSNLLRVREALCENRRGNLKVCCSSPPTMSVAPPPGTEGSLPARCGISLSSNRVFFGEFPPIGAYPWMAVLGFRSAGANGELEWKCGGALVSERYVLTAAHCVLPELQLEEIRLGEHNLQTVPDCNENRNCAPRHQSFKVASRSQIISHPNFDTRTPVSDDIALIRLDRKATLNNFVQPICLPDAQFNPKSFLGNQEAIVAGWGRTELGFDSNILKRTNIPLVETEKCQPLYNVRLNTDQLCFGGVGRRDSCNGDSGGPVFQADPRGINYLIGIVSFGNRCGEDPAIYTSVAPYRSWITQNMRP
ncbi:phenoloxidase-activating factor 3-like [Macrobrachium rosenbergii]|uniref:phenoloxidase-activating factor 3-like n=1 Tax=Macrobrachium rosenbergii TaxID=79674 RepID=UPI0034D39F09